MDLPRSHLTPFPGIPLLSSLRELGFSLSLALPHPTALEKKNLPDSETLLLSDQKFCEAEDG
jgi:hypothetical protein